MKKYLLFTLLILILTGCTKNINTNDKLYHDIKKANDYLYEITYDDYKYDKNLKTITTVEDFGCSSVKNGNYYGRNFDFIYNDIPEFVVKVNKTKERHASIGVTTLSGIHKSDDIEKSHKEKLELLPNFMLDGINDAGVICSDNVVPKEDVEPITGTNIGKEDLHIAFIVRYVLDNANSADHAIELLKDKNIYGDLGSHYNLHFMIADKNKTYVVEFIDNKIVVEEKKDNEQIMTNYYVNMDNLTENGAGVERYNILKDNYNEGNTFEGMWNLLKRVEYSNAYLFDTDNPWLSEYIPLSIRENKDSAEYNEAINLLDNIKKEYWVTRTKNMRTPSNPLFWQTTHNSTYDIKNKKLRVTIQENYDKYYEYILK